MATGEGHDNLSQESLHHGNTGSQDIQPSQTNNNSHQASQNDPPSQSTLIRRQKKKADKMRSRIAREMWKDYCNYKALQPEGPMLN